MTVQMDVWTPGKLPPLDADAIAAEESAAVNALFRKVRSPRKRLDIALGVIEAAHEVIEEHRGRRDELIGWLRWTATAAGLRNIGLPAATGLFYTRPHGIVAELEKAGVTRASIDPGTDPAAELHTLSKAIYRATVALETAIVQRDKAVAALANAGFDRGEVHQMMRGTVVASRLSQIAAEHGASFKR